MTANENNLLRTEIAYADGKRVHVITVEVYIGTTVKQAIELSGMLEECPDIDLEENKVGIFSEICTLDTEVPENSRIEIYRPLITDPKEARRKRAVSEKS